MPSGMGEVVRPLAVRYSATCHEWFSQGARARRTLPIIWVQRCRVSYVSRHAAVGSSGHGTCEVRLICHRNRPSPAFPGMTMPGSIGPGLYTGARSDWGMGEALCLSPASQTAAFRASTSSARGAVEAAAPPAPRHRLHRIAGELIDEQKLDHGEVSVVLPLQNGAAVPKKKCRPRRISHAAFSL